MKEVIIKVYHFIQIKTFVKWISVIVLWFVLLGVSEELRERKPIYKDSQLEEKGLVYMKLEEEKLGSYLFTDNLGKQYRLGANSGGCFDKQAFLKEVKTADTLNTYSTEQEWSKDIPVIYAIRKKEKELVPLECTRKSNSTGILPLLTIIGFYLVTFILVFNALNYLVVKILSLINNKRSIRRQG